jgi:AcrR family transcriptional regulator
MAGIRQFNEDEALDQMLGVFWQNGYGATSMQDLAKATGILRGSLYNAYGDKQVLFLLALQRYQTRFLDAAREVLKEADPAVALHNFFAYTIKSMTETVALHGQDAASTTRGCMTTKTATDETAMAEPIRAALRNMLDSLEKVLEERLAQADAAARLRLPPAEAARLAVTLTRGIVVMERVFQDTARLQATADSLVAVLLH